MKIVFTLILASFILLGNALPAQKSAATTSFDALVRDAQTFEPLPGATVLLLDAQLAAVADAQGHISFAQVKTGMQTLVVRYLGYDSDTLVLDLQAGKSQVLDIYLHAARLELQGIEITANQAQGLRLISRLGMQLRPVNSAQELLRTVPGLFIAQHAGGGKAEQIFLRGFDIDHGTDLALSADGMPVNMVSHAHGQGYADLHFLIPETVERLAIDKGPYTAGAGNLATAGAIDFQTRNSLAHNTIKLEGGMYNNFRALAMLRLLPARNNPAQSDAYFAGEYSFFKGYFEAPQNLHRLNTFFKYHKLISSKSVLSASLSDFRSQWNASGQIPERAVAQGLISPWGSLDPTEGGQTSRSNLNLQLSSALGQGWSWKQQVYASAYRFNLYSNFTFFANDSVEGDQIQQRESRLMTGYQSTLRKETQLLGRPFSQGFMVGIRMDQVGKSGLYHTQARSFLNALQEGSIQERNAFSAVDAVWSPLTKLQIGATLRADYLHFAYRDNLEQRLGTQTAQKAILNPRLRLDYFLSDRLQLFVKAGSGFHSNDTRVVLGGDAESILPRAWGSDVGAMFKPAQAMLVQVAFWGLAMQQEFVYVGDEGIVEPSGRSRRLGVDLSARWQLQSWLSADLDLNLAHARGLDAAHVASYIPLAPWLTSSAGLSMDLPAGWKASLRYRLLANRAADETRTLIAQGYCLVDAALSYKFKRGYTIGLSGQNLLNSFWKEAQFETTSGLQDEPAPISEIHYTPGTPLALKLSFTYEF